MWFGKREIFPRRRGYFYSSVMFKEKEAIR
jgi:hypothetical protein